MTVASGGYERTMFRCAVALMLVLASAAAGCGGGGDDGTDADLPILRTYGPGMSAGRADSNTDLVLRKSGKLLVTCTSRKRGKNGSSTIESGQETTEAPKAQADLISAAADGETLQIRDQFGLDGSATSTPTRNDEPLNRVLPTDMQAAIDAVRDRAAELCRRSRS